MQLELHEDGSTTPLPAQNIDTGLGLDRFAAILQDVPSVYETDHFLPLIEFGEELSGKKNGDDPATTRALRILADHGRGAAFLIADGVVPVERGPRLRAAPDHAPRDPAGPRARHRELPARARAGRDRHARRRLPGAAYRGRHDRQVGARRGGELRPHARPGRAPAARHHRARQGATRPPGSPPRTPSACTTRTASRTS